MNLEIVDFYPYHGKKAGRYIGTLHVYLSDLGVDVRGICVYKDKKHLFFRMPFRKTIDDETKEEVSYPIITFANANTNTEFMKKVIDLGKEYISQNYARSI